MKSLLSIDQLQKADIERIWVHLASSATKLCLYPGPDAHNVGCATHVAQDCLTEGQFEFQAWLARRGCVQAGERFAGTPTLLEPIRSHRSHTHIRSCYLRSCLESTP